MTKNGIKGHQQLFFPPEHLRNGLDWCQIAWQGMQWLFLVPFLSAGLLFLLVNLYKYLKE